jgi:hypothetical protein
MHVLHTNWSIFAWDPDPDAEKFFISHGQTACDEILAWAYRMLIKKCTAPEIKFSSGAGQQGNTFLIRWNDNFKNRSF